MSDEQLIAVNGNNVSQREDGIDINNDWKIDYAKKWFFKSYSK
jgi:hypothetical protein